VIKEIANALQGNKLTFLRLNSLHDYFNDQAGAGLIAGALRENTSLAKLDLLHCSRGTCKIIVDALKTNTSLTHLNVEHLKSRKIKDREEAKAFADLLTTNKTLTHFNFDLINNSGVRTIIKALEKYNNTLVEFGEVVVMGSRISSNRTAKAMCMLLKNNSTLVQISVECSYADFSKIAKALKYNTTLLNLSLKCSDIITEWEWLKTEDLLFRNYPSTFINDLKIVKEHLEKNRRQQYDTIIKAIQVADEKQNFKLSQVLYGVIQNSIKKLPENFQERDYLYLTFIQSLEKNCHKFGDFKKALYYLDDAINTFPEVQKYKVMLAEEILALPGSLFQDRLDDYRLIYLLMQNISDSSLSPTRNMLLKSVVHRFQLPDGAKHTLTSESLISLLGGELCTIAQFIEKNSPKDQLIFEHVFEVFINTSAKIYRKPDDYSQLDLKKIADDFEKSKKALMAKFKEELNQEEIHYEATKNDNKIVETSDKPSSFSTASITTRMQQANSETVQIATNTSTDVTVAYGHLFNNTIRNENNTNEAEQSTPTQLLINF
jgi:hypothetical protein